jgi:hypothetical protein
MPLWVISVTSPLEESTLASVVSYLKDLNYFLLLKMVILELLSKMTISLSKLADGLVNTFKAYWTLVLTYARGLTEKTAD